jgi:hypothetical protein
MVERMTTSLRQVPTLCSAKESAPGWYEVSLFSSKDVLQGDNRRAWSMALFQTMQEIALQNPLNGTCVETPKCFFKISDAYLSQHHLHYRVLLPQPNMFMLDSDPSSDDFYLGWWRVLLVGQESDRLGSKENAESVGKNACRDYVEAIAERFKLLNKPIPACSVLLATESLLYIVVDFPDLFNWLVATPPNNSDVLLGTIVRDFENTGYDGAVIFRSPWASTATA